MTSNNGTLKSKLALLREGEVLVLNSKDVANMYCGGKYPIPAHRQSPYHRLTKPEQCSLVRRAYKELILALKFPPQGVEADELPGAEFRVEFIRMERSR